MAHTWLTLFAAFGLLTAAARGAPPASQPQSPNCQAKLPLTEEVVRLLTKAASHATSSRACMDGPGRRVVIDQVLVCPADEDHKSIRVDASYRVTRWAEGDTRGCRLRPHKALPKGSPVPEADRNRPDLCSGTPGISRHRMRFTFVRRGKILLIELPAKVEDLLNMTPLDKVHSGGCYGDSGPFKPKRIRL